MRKLSIEGLDQESWPSHTLENHAQTILSSLRLPYYNAKLLLIQCTISVLEQHPKYLLLCAKRHWSNTAENCFKIFWFQVGPVLKLDMHVGYLCTYTLSCTVNVGDYSTFYSISVRLAFPLASSVLSMSTPGCRRSGCSRS